MSLADASMKKIDIVGPPGLMHQLASMRTYLYRFVPSELVTHHSMSYSYSSGMQVTASEMEARHSTAVQEPQAIFQDENLTVYGIHCGVVMPLTSSFAMLPDSF